ncbi:4-alpha-glucanotransferase [Caproicibacter fermentans]|uniref:4-alpha-glucanotransferase n=1 Tax=Caproicibacter fermentans TaxID=2576756 RepID=UPI0012ECDEE2|nr:4-alpha-glucanotransferase [Caproicibacter fermentans]
MEGSFIRTSGILLPVSSLPSRHGIGSLGKEAYQFIDFLKDAGQHYWQILPVGPTGCGDSPYQSFSAFAANPYLIDLDLLAEDGLLTEQEISAARFGDDPEFVDYGALYENRVPLLGHAAGRLNPTDARFLAFCKRNADWLDDYALFMALKAENGMVSFHDWPEPLRLRVRDEIEEAESHLGGQIHLWKAIQYLFFTQWGALTNYAHQNGIELIGDIPIYVSPDSSDLWTHPELFQVDEALNPTEVSGCPPDAFAPTGQLWGNPLYDWDRLERDGYAWWVRRLSFAARVYDVVRIDHFRGFESYYAVPAGDRDATGGRWRKGPGIRFVNVMKEKIPGIRIIAEDLGFLTDDVRLLLRESGFPGMKVLQFAFDSREKSDYLPYQYGRNCVVYTGTHDNTTTADWQHSAPPRDVEYARRYLNVRGKGETEFTYGMIRAALGSVADTCVIPMQDYLCLGAGARMNIPGTVGGNWRWRVQKEALTPQLAEQIRSLSVLFGRAKEPAST